MKKKEDIPFHFSFYDRSAITPPVLSDYNPTRYEAFFFGGKDLRIYPVADVPGTFGGHVEIIPYPGYKNPFTSERELDLFDIPHLINGMAYSWDIFFKFCPFSAIMWAMSLEYYIGPWEENEMQDAACSIHSLKQTAYKKSLILIKRNPPILRNKRISGLFSNVLRDAIHATNDEKRISARHLLDTHLLDYQGGGAPNILNRQQNKLALEILKELAEYFCSNVFSKAKSNELSVCELRQSISSMNALADSIKQNGDIRLRNLSKEAIILLLKSPKDQFVPYLVKAELDKIPKTFQNSGIPLSGSSEK